MNTQPELDPTGLTGKFFGMIRRIFGGAIRSTMEDVLREPLSKIADEFGELKAGLSRLEVRVDETNQRIDKLGARLDERIDGLGARLDGRIDGLDKRIGELTTQQSRMAEKIADLGGQVAGLGGEVAGLKRDQRSADVVERRLARIEDRVFARAS